jgi:DNA replication protein DnaC
MAAASPAAPCPVCNGFGAVETPEGKAVACRCRVEERAQARLKAAEIPTRYLSCRIENYEVKPDSHPSHARARLAAKRFIEEWPRRYGLLLVGPVGVGKTHLAVAILRQLVEDYGVRGLFCDFSDLLERIQATFSKTNSDSADDVIAPYRDAEVLVLDELGARRPTDWARDVLYSLVNTRYNRERVTIATSNYVDAPRRTGDETLELRVGAMVRSRLYDMCDLVEMDGRDHRAWQHGPAARR